MFPAFIAILSASLAAILAGDLALGKGIGYPLFLLLILLEALALFIADENPGVDPTSLGGSRAFSGPRMVCGSVSSPMTGISSRVVAPESIAFFQFWVPWNHFRGARSRQRHTCRAPCFRPGRWWGLFIYLGVRGGPSNASALALFLQAGLFLCGAGPSPIGAFQSGRGSPLPAAVLFYWESAWVFLPR